MSDIRRLQCAIWQDSLLPRDAFVITPHFKSKVAGFAIADQGLCDDLAAGLNTWIGVPTQITVKSYDAGEAAPQSPKATKTLNSGVVRASPAMREVALCLSYYATDNEKRKRGRLYIPWALMTGSASTGLRPAPSTQTKVSDLVSLFSGLGGADIDWVVFSRVDNQGRKVTNWWVDDEWDVIRSRGLRPTGRLAGATSG